MVMQNYCNIDINVCMTLPADSWHIQDLWTPHLYNLLGYLEIEQLEF